MHVLLYLCYKPKYTRNDKCKKFNRRQIFKINNDMALLCKRAKDGTRARDSHT